MSDLSMTLTDKAIGALPFAQNGRYRVHDADLKGFMVIVGKRGKTFYVEGYFGEDGKRQFSMMKTISDAGEITAREAREKRRKSSERLPRESAPAKRNGAPSQV